MQKNNRLFCCFLGTKSCFGQKRISLRKVKYLVHICRHRHVIFSRGESLTSWWFSTRSVICDDYVRMATRACIRGFVWGVPSSKNRAVAGEFTSRAKGNNVGYHVGISVEMLGDAVSFAREDTLRARSVAPSKESPAHAALQLSPEVNFVKPRDRGKPELWNNHWRCHYRRCFAV